jgi:prepilin-type N-terminal cleavage/methylation domain-containing protein
MRLFRLNSRFQIVEFRPPIGSSRNPKSLITNTAGRNTQPISAFTLIELLVVVAIIAILASLVLPVLSKAKQSSYATVCRNNLHQITLSIGLYASDYSVFPPYVAARSDSSLYSWWFVLRPYVKDTWPSTDLPKLTASKPSTAHRGGVFACPGYDHLRAYYINNSEAAIPSSAGAYGYNKGNPYKGPSGLGGLFRNSQLGLPESTDDVRQVSESAALQPSNLFTTGDSVILSQNLDDNHLMGEDAIHQEDFANPIIEAALGNSASTLNIVPNTVRAGLRRHSKKVMMGLLDAHVETLSFRQVYNSTGEVMRRYNVDNSTNHW